jgi:hypothetical protein
MDGNGHICCTSDFCLVIFYSQIDFDIIKTNVHYYTLKTKYITDVYRKCTISAPSADIINSSSSFDELYTNINMLFLFS